MKPLEITVLGSGSIVPTKDRNHAAFWIQREGDAFLWDCGEGAQKQLQKAELSFMKIDRIFITHWHADHFAGLIGMIESFNLEGRERKLEIYGPEASRFVSILSDLSWYDFGFDIEAVDVEFESEDEELLVEEDEYVIKAIPSEHSVPSVAYCLEEKDSWNINKEKAAEKGLYPGPEMQELKDRGRIQHEGKTITLEEVADLTEGRKVVYSGDTLPSENVKKIAEDADLLIHDATFVNERSHNHSSAEDAGKLAKEANVRKLLLTHYSRRYKNLTPLKEAAEKHHDNVDVARDLMKLEI
ncbi:MAG: ribonuclease Z [Candidatus Aenigmatarchaeota archaeon]